MDTQSRQKGAARCTDCGRALAGWIYGRDHGFVVWIRELLDDRLAEPDDDRTTDG